jgi:hypothetical protein
MTELGRIQARLRVASKELLGTQFRAEVAALIAVGEPPFWARRMHEQTGIPENKISQELARLAKNERVTLLQADPWDRRKLYEPGPSALWDVALELLDDAIEEEALRANLDSDEVFERYWAAVLPEAPVPLERRKRRQWARRDADVADAVEKDERK